MDEFEDRLRERLGRAASRAGDMPEVSDIAHRARRQRRVRQLTVSGALTAVILAVLAVAPFESRQRVQLVDRPDSSTEQPASTTPMTPDPDDLEPDDPESDDADPGDHTDLSATAGDPPGRACGEMEDLAVVFATTGGDLRGLCASGDMVSLLDGVGARNPAVDDDGRRIVYEADGELIALDTASGERTPLLTGRLPAFGSEEWLAWVEGEPGQARIEAGFLQSALAPEHDMGTAEVRDLAWDAAEEVVYFTDNFADRGPLWLWRVGAGDAPAEVAPEGQDGDGSRYLAVDATDTAGTVGLIRRVGLDEGLSLVTRANVLEDPEGELPVADLGPLELEMGGELARAQDTGRLWLEHAGPYAVEADDSGLRAAHSDADAPSWLLGDGETLWLVTPSGEATRLLRQVQSAAVNPVLDLGPPPGGTDVGESDVDVYFSERGENVRCDRVTGVARTVEGPGVLRGAIEALLAGPTENEEERGLWSFFSRETEGALRDARIDDGVAHLDFDDSLTQVNNMSTSCGAQSVIAQLEATSTQFPAVESVVYSLEGDVDAFYESLQLAPPEG